MKPVDFSETIAASDLKGSRGRHLIEYMKICDNEGQGHFSTLAQGRVHAKIQTGFSKSCKFKHSCGWLLYDSNESTQENTLFYGSKRQVLNYTDHKQMPKRYLDR